VKSALKWLLLTLGLGSLWLVTRVVAFYFVGVLTFFATAFQATINEMTKHVPSEEPKRDREQLPSRLAQAREYASKNPVIVDAEAAPEMIDLRDGVTVS
jgi:Tfp pilus assembly protein PilV